MRAVRSCPITNTDFTRARKLLGLSQKRGAKALSKAQAAQLESQRAAFRQLQKLSRTNGDVHQLDVSMQTREMGQHAGQSLRKMFDAISSLKQQGALAQIYRSETVSEEALSQLQAGKLSPRLTRHVQRMAGLEVYQLFNHPVRDAQIRSRVGQELKRDHRVQQRTLKGCEIKPEISLLEESARKRNALLVLLGKKKLPQELKIACIQKLAECGRLEDVEMLNKIAKGGTSVRNAARASIKAIKKAGKMTIVLTSMEVKPYVNGGGLGNVMNELPKALARMGHRVIVLMPRHDVIERDKLKETGKTGVVYGPDGAQEFGLMKDRKGGVDYYFIEENKYFSQWRPGVYGTNEGPYQDNAERYDFFGASIPVAIRTILGEKSPDVVQLNDAHTGSAAVYLKKDPAFKNTKTIMGLHNLGGSYQGKYDKKHLQNVRFNGFNLFHPGGPAEFYDQLNFLKLGLTMSDGVVAVSRQYAKEILEEKNGEGLHGIMRVLHAKDKLWGNMNGIDTASWNPATDPNLPAHYSFEDQAGKAVCKAKLQEQYGLPQKKETPLVGLVARLTGQKGFDEIVDLIRRTLGDGKDVQYVINGTRSEPEIAQALEDLAREYPENVVLDDKFTMTKERSIIAGSDFFLMPSKFEPCGLPQMYAMRYLTVPIVRGVGGLKESVQEYDPATRNGNGFKFEGDDTLHGAVDRALDWYQGGQKSRQALLRRCALADFSWDNRSAPEQVAFYRKIICS